MCTRRALGHRRATTPGRYTASSFRQRVPQNPSDAGRPHSCGTDMEGEFVKIRKSTQQPTLEACATSDGGIVSTAVATMRFSSSTLSRVHKKDWIFSWISSCSCAARFVSSWAHCCQRGQRCQQCCHFLPNYWLKCFCSRIKQICPMCCCTEHRGPCKYM